MRKYWNLCTDWNCWIVTYPPDKVIWPLKNWGLEFTFARREVYFLWLVNFRNFRKIYTLYLLMLKLLRILKIARRVILNSSVTAILLMSRTMKTQKLKLFYFQKNARYHAKELWRDIFLGNLSLKEGKNSVGLPVLDFRIWWRHMKTNDAFIHFSHVFNSLLGVWISDETLFLALDTLEWEMTSRCFKQILPNWYQGNTCKTVRRISALILTLATATWLLKNYDCQNYISLIS